MHIQTGFTDYGTVLYFILFVCRNTTAWQQDRHQCLMPHSKPLIEKKIPSTIAFFFHRSKTRNLTTRICTSSLQAGGTNFIACLIPGSKLPNLIVLCEMK